MNYLCFSLSVCLATVSIAGDIKHGFLACGSQTYIVDGDGQKLWTYPYATRDGYVMPDGAVVLAVNSTPERRGGAVVEVSLAGTTTLIHAGTQSEVNSVQPTHRGKYVITEAGAKPRLLEVDRQGTVLLEFALQCQTADHHMETRMARQLQDGTFLVPHLLDFAVRHYDRDGKVLATLDTTVKDDHDHQIHSWPFTAIRHGQNQTLVCCTHSNRVIEFAEDGSIAWQLTNEDLPGEWLQDPCGAQVLPNGNIVITSYAAGGKDPAAPKLIEVTRDRSVVWTYTDGSKTGIHHFQILDTNGEKLIGLPQK